MRWKFIISAFTLSIGSLLFIVFHYQIDPRELASLSFYENLANPSVRIVMVPAGYRKEQIAEIVGDKLGWSENEKEQFINPFSGSQLAVNVTKDASKGTANLEGHYFPKTYFISKYDTPNDVITTMVTQFTKETDTIKKPKSTNVINADTALKVASIVQREAAGKGDMKLISGIIWNRIFSGMKLQIDATLQYAKGNEEDGWWDPVKPADKNIDSSYNTYLHVGLPPSPISNPSLAAIDAAYNPTKTSCLYFMHDKKGTIHCAATYEQHKKNIAK